MMPASANSTTTPPAPDSHAGPRQLFDNDRPQLVRFLMRYTGNRELAENVAQAACMRALAGKHSEAAQAGLPALLLGSALVLARAAIRHRNDGQATPPVRGGLP
jgi:DNA-directed RNA polymerase specialized sigma24 family protein